MQLPLIKLRSKHAIKTIKYWGKNKVLLYFNRKQISRLVIC